MNSLSSALIFSENFITSVTLSNILKKLGVKYVFESNSSKNALSVITNSSPKYIFVDSTIKEYQLEAVVRQLQAFTNAEIIILGLPENKPAIEKQLASISGKLNFLSKPIISDEVERIIIKENTRHFFGVLT